MIPITSNKHDLVVDTAKLRGWTVDALSIHHRSWKRRISKNNITLWLGLDRLAIDGHDGYFDLTEDSGTIECILDQTVVSEVESYCQCSRVFSESHFDVKPSVFEMVSGCFQKVCAFLGRIVKHFKPVPLSSEVRVDGKTLLRVAMSHFNSRDTNNEVCQDPRDKTWRSVRDMVSYEVPRNLGMKMS